MVSGAKTLNISIDIITYIVSTNNVQHFFRLLSDEYGKYDFKIKAIEENVS